MNPVWLYQGSCFISGYKASRELNLGLCIAFHINYINLATILCMASTVAVYQLSALITSVVTCIHT
jgi:hypothetical protein